MAPPTDAVAGLQEQNAALRRVTRLITRHAELEMVFDPVVSEVARVLDASACLLRDDPDGWTTVLASLGDPAYPKGSRWPSGGFSLLESSLAAPVVVDGVTWGVLCARLREPSQPDAEAWLQDVAELVSMAVAGASSRAALRRQKGEQAALRHVATLVAEGSSLSDLFAAVARAVAQAIEADAISVERIDADRSTTVIASLDAPRFPIGSRWPLDEPGLHASVITSGRPVRIDDVSVLSGATGAALRESAIRSLVAAPIVVSGGLWGLMWAGGKRAEPLAAATETRLRDFTEFAAVAVANADSRNRLRRLADSEASLRRVATLAAEGATPAELLSAVADEAARILDGSSVAIVQYEGDDSFHVVAAHNDPVFEVGSSWPVEEASLAAAVRETRAPVRIHDFSETRGMVAEAVRAAGLASAIGAPIVVDANVWGMIVVGIRERRGALPLFTGWYTSRMLSSSVSGQEIESRLASFTELAGTAISRAHAQSELIASRVRIVEAGDEARRRIERDLHDGTQQRLVALALHLQRLRGDVSADERLVQAGFEQVERELRAVIDEVRELSRGVHPAQLEEGGLRPALRALARRSPIPVDLSIDVAERPPASVETAIYYVVSESLANAIKHSRATSLAVTVARDSGAVRATVADDGVGGAEMGAGSGLTGLSDRVDALAGRFSVVSPRGGGTTVSVELPVAAR
ncbi:MAG TPA: GAF domain-containing protein [Gaiellaceae bacterium]|nr:GAF domain-containing protein [Gaiellaceae bacterium]